MADLALDLIVVSWNSAGWVLYLAEQLRACAGWRRLLVVDNASEPNERRALERFLPERAELLSLPLNLGVAGAWNEAYRRSDASLLALLNTDLRFHNPRALHEATAKFAADPSLGVLAIADNEPPAWYQEGRIVSGALAPAGVAVECDCVTGAAYCFRRELGPFDETFSPAYCEETDHCLRARERGYRVVQCGLGVEHLSGGLLRTRFEEPARAGLFEIQQRRLKAKWAGRWPPAAALSGGS